MPEKRERPHATRSGQALIEACIVIALTALLLFGALQLAFILSAREILEHAAARGARARTVGFNHNMVSRVIDAASIPISGRMLTPEYENEQADLREAVTEGTPGRVWDFALRTTPDSRQATLEIARIPEYLGAENLSRARYVLDYQDWDTETGIRFWDTVSSGEPAQARVHTEQDYRLWVPMHRAFYADDRVELDGDCRLEAHYPLYLEDQSR